MCKELLKMDRYLCDHFSQVFCDFVGYIGTFFVSSFTKIINTNINYVLLN